jgi:hypothetical protein
VPYARFKEVNQKATTAEQRVTEYEKKLQAYAWAEGLDPAQVADTVRWRTQAHQDPLKFLREAIQSAPEHLQPQLRSELGRMLASRAPEAKPAPDLQTDTGKPVYSAEQYDRLQEWQARKQQAEWDKRLAPLQQELQQGRDLRERAARDVQTKTFAANAVKDAKTWPHFTEHAAEIAQELQKLPPGNTEAEESFALSRAYITVLNRSVFPKYTKTAEDTVLANLKTKAAASSEHPGRATTAAPTRPKSLGAALRAEADKAGWR